VASDPKRAAMDGSSSVIQLRLTSGFSHIRKGEILLVGFEAPSERNRRPNFHVRGFSHESRGPRFPVQPASGV
jgi:hypothetical protein